MHNTTNKAKSKSLISNEIESLTLHKAKIDTETQIKSIRQGHGKIASLGLENYYATKKFRQHEKQSSRGSDVNNIYEHALIILGFSSHL